MHIQKAVGGVQNKRGSRKFCQRGSKFDYVFFLLFLVVEGFEDPNITKNGPSSARQRNVIEIAFRWRADDGPTLNASLVALCQGIWTSIAQKPYIDVIFQGGGGSGPPVPTSGSALAEILLWSFEQNSCDIKLNFVLKS